MLDNAEIIAARRRSYILNERDKIDFKHEYENLQVQIAEAINKHSTSSSVEFKIMVKNAKVPKGRKVIPLKLTPMTRENRIQLFYKIQDWLEGKNYEYLEVQCKNKLFTGFIVSWEDEVEVEPFDFLEESPEQEEEEKELIVDDELLI